MRLGPIPNVARLTIDETITALWTFAHANGLLTDDINERTGGAGVTVDGVRMLDRSVTPINFPASSTPFLATQVVAEADNRVIVRADGLHLWGDGTNPPDTNLYRGAANLLKTDDMLTSAGQPRARVSHSAAQNVNNLATISVAWDSETFDVGAMHDVAVNNNRLTIPANADGIYVFVAQIRWAFHAAGVRQIVIRDDGAVIFATDTCEPVSTNPYGSTHHVTGVYEAAAGDWFEVRAFQNSGGVLAIQSANSWFAAVKVA